MKTPLKFPIQIDGRSVNVTMVSRAHSCNWQAQFFIAGIAHRPSTGETNIHRAKLLARDLVEAAWRAHKKADVGAATSLKALVADYLAVKYPKTNLYAHATKQKNSYALDRFQEFAGESFDLTVLDTREARALVQRFLNGRAKAGCKGTTINTNRRSLSGFFTFLISENRVRFEVNPAHSAGLDTPADDTIPAAPLSLHEFQTFLEVAKRRWYYIGIVLVAGAGLRPIGAVRLKWGDIDRKGQVLKVWEKGHQHEISYNDWTASELRRAFRRQKKRNGRVTRKDRLIPHKRDWLTKKTTKLFKRVFGDDTPYRLRNLRNSFQQWLLDAGADVKDVARLAKNSEKIVLTKYAKQKSTKLHATANLIDFRLKKEASTKSKENAG